MQMRHFEQFTNNVLLRKFLIWPLDGVHSIMGRFICQFKITVSDAKRWISKKYLELYSLLVINKSLESQQKSIHRCRLRSIFLIFDISSRFSLVYWWFSFLTVLWNSHFLFNKNCRKSRKSAKNTKTTSCGFFPKTAKLPETVQIFEFSCQN